MVQIEGSYKLEKNENLDEFYASIGVPWFARKMMAASSPTMFVTNEDEHWNFKTVTFLRTIENSFKLDEEYEETLPNGKELESITSMDGENKFVTKSKSVEEGDDFQFERQYEFNDEGMVMTLKSSSAEKVAKRYFKRLQ